jgi:hypothetical protein
MSGAKLAASARAAHHYTITAGAVPSVGQQNPEAVRVRDRVLQISTEFSPSPAFHVIRLGVEGGGWYEAHH